MKVFKSVLENFRLALSPDPTDCPWVSEDGSFADETSLTTCGKDLDKKERKIQYNLL